MIGQGDLITGTLKQLENKALNLPRQSLKKWKDFVVEVK